MSQNGGVDKYLSTAGVCREIGLSLPLALHNCRFGWTINSDVEKVIQPHKSDFDVGKFIRACSTLVNNLKSICSRAVAIPARPLRVMLMSAKMVSENQEGNSSGLVAGQFLFKIATGTELWWPEEKADVAIQRLRPENGLDEGAHHELTVKRTRILFRLLN